MPFHMMMIPPVAESNAASHDDTPASRTPALVAIVTLGTRGFGPFRIFFVDKILWLNGHVNHVCRFLIEFQICIHSQSSSSEYSSRNAYL